MTNITYTVTKDGLAVLVDGKQVGGNFLSHSLNIGDVVRWLRDGAMADMIAQNQEETK